MLKPPANNILVKCTDTMESTMSYGELTIELDTSFEPDWHRKIHAEVVALPERIDSDFYALNNMEPVVKIGDRIFFHYLSLTDGNKIIYGGEEYYLVEYFQVFAVERAGEFFPINGVILLEQIVDNPNISETGILLGAFSKTSEQVGRVAFASKPLKGMPDVKLETGEVLAYSRSSDFKNNFNGEEYLTMTYADIVAKIK